MNILFRPFLELSVVIPGMLLAYLPMYDQIGISFRRLNLHLFSLLALLCLLGGLFCGYAGIGTGSILTLILILLGIIYIKTLPVSVWKSASIFLAVCAVFSCLNSFSRAIDAVITAAYDPEKTELWFTVGAGVLYNLLAWLFVAITWYPATHSARTLVIDENFAQTWYVFWILPLIFIGLNIYIVPKYKSTLYTGRILAIYIVMSIVLLFLLVLFYTMFLLIASSLNRNAKLQQENYFLSMQQTRYKNLCSAIEETRHARHDLRHHFNLIYSMAEANDLKGIQEYLKEAGNQIPDLDMCFCENRIIDSVIGYYCALAKRNDIPFRTKLVLPEKLPTDDIDLCLVFSNLLENALEASLKTAPEKRRILVEASVHAGCIVLIHVENAYSGEIKSRDGVFLSTKENRKNRKNGIGIQSVRRICEKCGGASTFTYTEDVFTAQVMLRG